MTTLYGALSQHFAALRVTMCFYKDHLGPDNSSGGIFEVES